MNRNFCLAAFGAGLMIVAWVGVGYAGSNPLALTMTLIIGAVYGLGALEMQRFRQATATLAAALAAIPENLTHLDAWLGSMHISLQNPVRLRIEGERVGLPGPALTPYLVGLLVMLGMLGTFLGMVVTLSGAVFALEGSTDLQTMRSSLAAPIRGLGLAFGTSVAGVASSAMLGLISALCRRERLQVAQLLDTKIAGVLRGFSLVHQRQETFKALQFQAQALPQVVDKLQALLVTMDRQNQQLNERLVANQESFHHDVQRVYTELAGAVDVSLKASLTESVRAIGDSSQALVATTLQGIARETAALRDTMAGTVKTQLDGFAHGFEQRAAALVTSLQTDLAERDGERLAAMSAGLEALAAGLQREWQQAGAQTLAQQQQICATLERTAHDMGAQAQAHAGATIAEIGRLLESAAEAPRAAAAAIGELRREISNGIARDNEQLAERGRIMATLTTLLDTIAAASGEQRAAIEALVGTTATLLERAGGQFEQRLDAESARMADAATQVAAGAVEVSSLGEAFGFAVQQFGDANDKMMANLERIGSALDKSMARSDDQLAYYVAQAREIIDLSIMSQKQIVDDLQQLAAKQAPHADGMV